MSKTAWSKTTWSKTAYAVAITATLVSSSVFAQTAGTTASEATAANPTLNPYFTDPGPSAGHPARLDNDTPTAGAPGGDTATGGPSGGLKHN